MKTLITALAVTAMLATFNAALSEPRMKAEIADLGGTPLPGSPAEFAKFIADETEKWAKVIRTANIKL